METFGQNETFQTGTGVITDDLSDIEMVKQNMIGQYQNADGSKLEYSPTHRIFNKHI